MLLPLILLGIGAICVGFFFKEIFIGYQSIDFWKNSIFFLKVTDHGKIPLWLLIITPSLVILAIPISYYYFIKDVKILEKFIATNKPLYNFLLNKWYIDELYDVIFVKSLKKLGLFFWKQVDQNIIDRFGPDGFAKLIKLISNKAVKLQSGYIYDYAFVMLIGLTILITYLILN